VRQDRDGTAGEASGEIGRPSGGKSGFAGRLLYAVSHERDRRHREPGRGPDHTTRPVTPGKVTLTAALTGMPVHRIDPRRDVGWTDEGEHGARGPSPAGTRVAGPGGGGAAAGAQVVLDQAFTPALVAALRAHPGLDLDMLLEQLATDALGEGSEVSPLSHPGLVQAAGPGSSDDLLRAAAMTSLQQAKHRLLAASRQRRTTPRQLDEEIQQHASHAPDPDDVEATRQWSRIRDAMCAARPRVQHAFDLAVDHLWTSYARMLRMLRRALRYPVDPPEIEDHDTLAAQLDYLDDLWSACAQPTERTVTAPAAPVPQGCMPQGDLPDRDR
jgi:hypothetical protein